MPPRVPKPPTSDPFRRLPSLADLVRVNATLEQEIRVLKHNNRALVDVISELELRTLFALHHIRVRIPAHAGVITSITGKPEMRELSLLELFEETKDQFAAYMLKLEQAKEKVDPPNGEATHDPIDASVTSLARAASDGAEQQARVETEQRRAAAHAHTNGAGRGADVDANADAPSGILRDFPGPRGFD